MVQPLVIAYHLIWTAYGWWLSNDPRGSSSHTIRNPVLAELGHLHHGRKAIQPASGDIRRFYHDAQRKLAHSLLTFDEHERRMIAEGLAAAIEEHRYTCYACAIMPDHVHMLIRKHRHQAEEMISHLQYHSRLRFHDIGLREEDHPVWGGPGWKVFLDHPEDIRRTIGYVEKNPDPLRLPRQSWPFVQRYDGWPLHPGHSPNSPYAKRLRAAGRYPYNP